MEGVYSNNGFSEQEETNLSTSVNMKQIEVLSGWKNLWKLEISFNFVEAREREHADAG